jgi:hypothetical protein
MRRNGERLDPKARDQSSSRDLPADRGNEAAKAPRASDATAPRARQPEARIPSRQRRKPFVL